MVFSVTVLQESCSNAHPLDCHVIVPSVIEHRHCIMVLFSVRVLQRLCSKCDSSRGAWKNIELVVCIKYRAAGEQAAAVGGRAETGAGSAADADT